MDPVRFGSVQSSRVASSRVECHTVDSVKLAIFMALPVATDLLNGCSRRTIPVSLSHCASLSLSGARRSPKMGSCETFKI